MAFEVAGVAFEVAGVAFEVRGVAIDEVGGGCVEGQKPHDKGQIYCACAMWQKVMFPLQKGFSCRVWHTFSL